MSAASWSSHLFLLSSSLHVYLTHWRIEIKSIRWELLSTDPIEHHFVDAKIL
jgi:hypothetical protein